MADAAEPEERQEDTCPYCRQATSEDTDAESLGTYLRSRSGGARMCTPGSALC